MAVPKWQEPLVERAATAEKTLRAVMHAPGGGAGAMAAAAAADQDLAELCRAVAARSGSPLLQQLLMNGARALDAHANALLAATIDPDELAVPAAPTELDEDQALVEATLEPVETSDDAPTNVPADEQAQASLDEDQAVVEQKTAQPTISGDASVDEQYAAVLQRWQDSLVDVVDEVEFVRIKARWWLMREDAGAREAAADAVAGIDRCVSTLHKLRAELVSGLSESDAASGGVT